MTRLLDDPAKNVERWKKLPYMMDYQEAGTPKPGATVLAEMNAGAREVAAAGNAELWTWTDGGDGDFGDVAMADEPGAGRSDA